MSTRTDVLINGAGPSGLVLALWLTQQGVRVHINDKSESTATTSRALAVQARVLELYRQLDLGDEVAKRAYPIREMNLWSQGEKRAHFALGNIGQSLTPYPAVYIYPQDHHEKLLEERLNAMGVYVERNVELLEFTQHDSHVTATFKHHPTDSTVTHEAAFIVGADGAHSTVRHACEIDFEGGKYDHLFYVADIEGSGPTLNGQGHVNLYPDFMLTFAYDRDHSARLVGAVNGNDLQKNMNDLTLFDVANPETTHLKIDKVNWFTVYRIHHRVAKNFRKGRAFLIGDAGHIHSPAGGQGMNTGIGDAINLAWKLAAVIKGKTDYSSSLLDSYETERRGFAQVLISSTDTAFKAISAEGYIADTVRTWLVPYIAPLMVSFDFFKQNSFLGASQLRISYRDTSVLSAGSPPQGSTVKGGDRLPWAPVGDAEKGEKVVDNYDSLGDITWQVHVYGEAKKELANWCKAKGIPLHVFSWNKKYQDVGLGRDAAYLLRPDTYIAVVEPSGLPKPIQEYSDQIPLRLD